MLEDDGAVVAEARPAEPEHRGRRRRPSPAVAAAAAEGVGAWGPSEFAECFVCGTRDDGSGLGIHPGLVPGGDGLVATTWVAREVSPEVVWAAIDCPGAYATGDPDGAPIVLGRMTARVDRLPEEGERCVVVGWPLGEDGRKLFAGTALFGRGGELLGASRGRSGSRPRDACLGVPARSTGVSRS